MDKGVHGRRDRLVKGKRHDVYRKRQKWPEPTRCTGCGAVYVKGRWTWEQAPADAHEAVCAACRRIADNYPAGIIELQGPFFEEHRVELLHLVRNVEEQEKGQHPLERIMDVTQEADCTRVTTTGIHLARRIGDALHRAYQGELDLTYAEGAKRVRISWQR